MNTNRDDASLRHPGVPGWPSRVPVRDLVVRYDTREREPWTFRSVDCQRNPCVTLVRKTLKAGDYALDFDPTLAAVERKSLADFARCCGSDRERFFKQVALLKGSVDRPLIIIEADYAMIEIGTGWRGRLTPEQVLGTLHKVTNIVPVLLCRTRDEAERACYRHLKLAFSSAYKRAREFARMRNEGFSA